MMNDEHSSMAMSYIEHAAQQCMFAIQDAASEYAVASAVYRPKIYMDGNKWCALYGDDLASGVCGFGDTPALAVRDFNDLWYGIGKYKELRGAK
jgi:hypothetical protein